MNLNAEKIVKRTEQLMMQNGSELRSTQVVAAIQAICEAINAPDVTCKLTAAPYPPPPFSHRDFDEFRMNEERIAEALTETIRKYQIAISGLTEKQTAEVFKQAIACGDFTQLIRQGDGAQQVIYLPYNREQELTSRIVELEAQLKAQQYDASLEP